MIAIKQHVRIRFEGSGGSSPSGKCGASSREAHLLTFVKQNVPSPWPLGSKIKKGALASQTHVGP